MLKSILITFLLLTTTLMAEDARLNNYSQTKAWLKDANSNADSAYNIGHTYQTKIKDYDKAIYWYKKAYKLDKGSDVANNLGYLYDDIKEYKKAIKWYKVGIEQGDADSSFNLALLYKRKLKDYPNAIKYYTKAISMGDKSAAFNLGLLYKNKLKDYQNAIKYYKKAYEMGEIGGANSLGYLYNIILKDSDTGIKWYKKGAKGGNADAINNLGRVYHKLKDDITSSAYILAMINYGYSKKEVFDFLKNDWKIDKTTLEKAYKLQLKLDIPKHYKGGIN
jgi:TPR repeat protein